MAKKAYVIELKIGTMHFAVSDSWRAGTTIGGMQVFSQGCNDPVSAVQSLMLKIGSGHDNTDVAIESALSNGDFFALNAMTSASIESKGDDAD